MEETEKSSAFAGMPERELCVLKQKEAHERFQKTDLLDDILFNMAMENTEICRIFLSVILGKKIVSVSYKETKKALSGLPGYKSVRLDAFAADSEGNTYNVEMQKQRGDSMPKRARFYQGILDVHTLYSGDDFKFKMLPQNYIIFITDFDVFGYSRYQYTFTNRCHEVDGLNLGDGTTKIFLNVKGSDSAGTSPILIQLLKLIAKTVRENTGEFAEIQEVYRLINKLKDDSEKERKFMSAEREREIWLEEGMEKGIEETRKIFKLRMKGLSPEQIATQIQLSLEEVIRILE